MKKQGLWCGAHRSLKVCTLSRCSAIIPHVNLFRSRILLLQDEISSSADRGGVANHLLFKPFTSYPHLATTCGYRCIMVANSSTKDAKRFIGSYHDAIHRRLPIGSLIVQSIHPDSSYLATTYVRPPTDSRDPNRIASTEIRKPACSEMPWDD